MLGINKVVLMGYLGNAPEHRILESGTSIATMSIATSKRWLDDDTKEIKEKTEWHRVTLFGKKADIAAKYLSKGSPVYVEAELQNRKYQDKDDNTRYTTDIIVKQLQMLPNGTSSDNSIPKEPVPSSTKIISKQSPDNSANDRKKDDDEEQYPF